MKLNAFILYNTKLINSIFDFQDNKEYSNQANIKYVNFLAARSTESGDYQSHGSRSRTVSVQLHCPAGTSVPERNALQKIVRDCVQVHAMGGGHVQVQILRTYCAEYHHWKR